MAETLKALTANLVLNPAVVEDLMAEAVGLRRERKDELNIVYAPGL
jgi:hypothetical protein